MIADLDEAALAERARREEEARRRREDDLRAVLELPAGRRLLFRLIDEVAGVFSPSYAGDSLGNAYGEGRRSVGIALLLEAQAWAPGDYLRALNEALEAKQLAQARTRSTPNPTL